VESSARVAKTTKACRGKSLPASLTESQSTELASAFKVLADPIRVRLLSLIAASPEGEVCACDLVDTLKRSQPTISHHLGVLCDAGFLSRERQGTWIWYSVVPERWAQLRVAFDSATVVV
jgi:ArsR family transcriptional regulator